MKIFCDSSFLVGYYFPADQHHKKSVELLKTLNPEKPQLILSEYIYDEVMTFVLSTHPLHGYLQARIFDADVIIKQKFNLVFISENTFYKSREIFNLFNKDKQWSFTDCTSFAVMEDLGIRNVLTFDKNFIQRGFRVIS